ncbi:type 2 lanthipeptide synthetase LanM family protein [Lysobacter capsici]|uniref:type 2 lanthipeptide synthetase LanM family protein n=1 Tax=Lysobacter capsici TaxID=435897 RepID=UPI001C002BBB|nr:type 2 lanthipeptide synthetase LanM family protein [Lysobacter capsici]QWF15529.1 type 2 lantipeptide synthetase LanM family protein [Lysobacter capsici]
MLRWAEPIIAPARERCLAQWRGHALRDRHAFDLDRLRASIEHAFAAPALAWSQRSVLLELAIARHRGSLVGDTPQQRHGYFLDWIDSAAGRRELDDRYRLLSADIAAQATRTEAFLTQFAQRLSEDRAQLAPLFAHADEPGRLLDFDCGLGDRHDHGGSVIDLRFEHGRVLYKPRSLAMDGAYATFLARLAEHGIEPVQAAATTLDRGDYGYAAWIEHRPLADEHAAQRYYQRYGGLTAIAYVLACTDLHLENLIACGDYPIVIDLETVLQPWMTRAAASQPGVRSTGPYAPSVVFSGLVPGGRNEAGAQDLSGLAWAEYRFDTRRAVDADSDQLRLAPIESIAPPGRNLPHLADGRRIAPHLHSEAIVDGFDRTYRGLLRLKSKLDFDDGLLAPFARLRTRALLRSTHIYARLLDALSHPQHLQSQQQRDAVLARLEVGQREWPFLARTQAAEREALLRGDVPRFTIAVDGTGVEDGDGRRIDAVFARSGRDEARRRLRILSERDRQRQTYTLTQSLESLRPWSAIETERDSAQTHAASSSDDDAHRRLALDTAIALGDELLRLSFNGRGERAWFQPEYRNRPEPSLAPMGLTLYEGLPGVLLMFAELGAQSGLLRFTRAADSVLTACRRQLREDPHALASIGPWSGYSGWMYALLVVARRWQRADLLDEAASMVPRIADRIAADRDFDLISGAAGALRVLLELQRLRPSAQTLTAINACAAHLIEHAQRGDDGAWWRCPASPERGLGGFAHGNAGIGAALAGHATLTGDDAALQLAREALRYERNAYRRRGQRWYDLFEHAAPSDGCPDAASDIHSWCHGAPGVGFARLLLPESLRDAAWREDLRQCIASTRESGLNGGHCLCHGQWGNLDLLIQHAALRGDRDALAECRALGAALIEQAHPHWHCGGRSPRERPLGLMVGLAGIAYGCLRLADPANAACVLMLSTGPQIVATQ